MQSSNHIGKIVRQHADAVENGKVESRKRKAKPSGISALATVPKHRAFVPMLTIWGGLLLALITAVLPDQAIARTSSLTGVYLPLLVTRLILCVGIGLGGALLGYIVASALSNRAKVKDGDGVLVSTFKSRDVKPINPTADLGSDSFDAPFEDKLEAQPDEPEEQFETQDSAAGEFAEHREPNLGELSQRGYDIEAPEEFGADEGKNSKDDKGSWAFTRKHFKEALIESCEGATCEAAAGWERSSSRFKPIEPAPAPHSDYAPLTAGRSKPAGKKPRSLDLQEFAQLPGRNGAWVEEQRPEVVKPPVETSAAPDEPKLSPVPTPRSTPASALAKLRQSSPDELSLVEMVERFAAALHDHQALERKRVAEGQAARETALAEALKALSLFTEAGFDQGRHIQVSESQIGQTEGELRGALERLQQLRGAA